MTTVAGTTGLAPQRCELVWCPADGAARDVVVTATGDATVGDLAEQLCGRQQALAIDGVVYETPTRLEDVVLRRGAMVAAGAPRRLPSEGVVDLAVIGGLLAGQTFALTPGVYTIGRGSDNDIVLDAPTVSASHAVLTIPPSGDATLVDLQSTNGCRVGGVFLEGPCALPVGAVVQIGAIALRLRDPQRQPAHLGPVNADAVRAFNRPPRPPALPTVAPVPLPGAPPAPSPRARLAWTAMAAPLLFGIGMAVFYDPRFAAFALFSPAMMLGTWLEDRRRARREARTGASQTAAAITQLREQLDAAAIAERQRRHELHPDPAALCARLSRPDVRLWERRCDDADFGVLTLGLGSVAWAPPTQTAQEPAAEVAEVVAACNVLREVPVPVRLAGGDVVGVCGPREVAAGLLRSLVLQAAALHGPADLRIAVLTSDGQEWDWAKWLPHTAGADGTRMVAVSPQHHEQVVAGPGQPADGVTLLVLDADDLTQGRTAPARPLLARDDVATLVFAPTAERLPAACTTVVTLQGTDGRAAVVQRGVFPSVDDLVVAGIPLAMARSAAVAAAGLDDPEVRDEGRHLPERVALLDLLGIPVPDVPGVAARWEQQQLTIPIGMGEDGPVLLDLAQDGPHGLIAGTTGAGKSELLRSIVAGLAATASPEDVTFVLIDYKGGSAFDDCAGLPHTVGLVTDLDEQLGQRALRCLDAELRYRERLLRDVGAADLAAYRSGLAAGRWAQPLPRLVVIVDEFAALAAELPEFMDRLVSVAQRGRSLGVHLLLATQRPAGAVSDHIRANMNLRIALRVQDAADSADVLGSPAAAELTRHVPGRAYVRRGPDELVCFQTALVTGATAQTSQRLVVGDFTAMPAPVAADTDGNATDLHTLVTEITAAFDASGMAAPRRPWPDPLPPVLPADELPLIEQGVALGLLDDPDRQRREPLTFHAAGSSMLLYGTAGSGPTTVLTTLALGLTGRDVDCYVIDAGAAGLGALCDLPHVGAVIRVGERERCERLVRHLTDEVARRQAQLASGQAQPTRNIVVLLDNYAGFAAAFDDLRGLALLDTFARVVADGPGLGISVVLTADRATAVPVATAATVARRIVFRLADRLDYSAFGLAPADVGELPANRGVIASSGAQVQIAEAGVPLEQAVAARADGPRTAPGIGVLPTVVAADEIAAAAQIDEEWFLPLAIGNERLATVGLRLGPGDGALVTGPPRSGKSTALALLAATVTTARPDLLVAGVAPRRSPLRQTLAALAVTADDVINLAQRIDEHDGPVLLLVDDADLCDDAAGALAALLAQRRDDLHVVAAGRADVLRTAYGHWTTELRRSRQGLALRPNIDTDGDLWHTTLPRTCRGPFPPGRGFLVCDGETELVQVAQS